MSEYPWFRAWRGDYRVKDHKYLPGSDGQGKQLARSVLSPLRAQIAVFFGQSEGTLANLQDGVMKLAKGELILCEFCRQDIWNKGHTTDCQIVIQYQQVLQPPP